MCNFTKSTLILVVLVYVLSSNGFSQTKTIKTIKKIGTIKPTNISDDTLLIEKVSKIHAPGGNEYNKMVLERKKTSTVLYPRKSSTIANKTEELTSASEPILGKNFDVTRTPPSNPNITIPIVGDGTPLDNTLAISNDGILLTAINTKIYAHDLNGDTAMYDYPGLGPGNYYKFNNFASIYGNLSTSFPFDPKLLYDPNNDRFILTFISGREPSNTKLIIAFSSTNNPKNDWHLYEIEGNPRQGNEWSDYPAIALSQSDLFLTINLIIDGVSWQEGFNGSLIWQMGLDSAYAGANELEINLWDDIKFENKYIRNLNPVGYADTPNSDDMYFLSNRNFDIQNDTIFFLKIDGSTTNPNTSLSIEHGILDTKYGMPPNGIQQDTDTNDATSGLQTNDSRWLGALLFDDNIQFVGNTINPENGRASIYHGNILNINTPNKTYTGNIISSDSLDLGYPNIAFTGKNLNENQVIIGFEHTSNSSFPGVSAIYYSNQEEYSNILQIRNGDNYVNEFNNNTYGGYERWGDYFGIQRKYNEPGTVWTSGVFGNINRRNSIHLAELTTPDTSFFEPNTITKNKNNNSFEVFPNPFFEDLNLMLNVNEVSKFNIEVFTIEGKLVYKKDNITVDKGRNRIALSTRFFPASTYVIKVFSSDLNKLILNKKVIKHVR